ncbi:membrane protease subunit, stomatin/prohibitin [candidate division WOR-1 bacterium DG_54_3]|uniref:Membrane protease subunit, stomatin/prohibitin n=1 Tax=candidate division WOR-1 bacterium DG_54_3 TaxID=1703775 RepID=A0A0S7XR93_UNCSA|nr:MAG: membrane protease subunit, stomatin/prohibitin [candidate division WOR-1 bacterium DG_54_3]
MPNGTEGVWIGLSIILLIAIVIIIASGIRIVRPYQKGLVEVLGSFKGLLDPGFHLVIPMITRVTFMDLRLQTLDVARQEVITKDNSPTNVDAVIYIKVVDPYKAYYEVQNYRQATVFLAQTTLRSVIGEMELDEILYNREVINAKLRDILDTATDAWGVKVDAVEIREVDPVGPVKAAMEEQTSSERERRAAILRADGQKRAAILVAEGDKRSRILQAEGVRQAKILEAEGQRLATILEGQGEAQKLRILAMGAAPLDQKALTVLSIDAVRKLGDGQATKIIFPFELTRLIEGASDYIGVSRKTPEVTPTTYDDLERMLGKAEDILGEIPKPGEIREKLATIEEQIEKEAARSEEIAHIQSRKGPVKLPGMGEEEK